MRFRGPGTWMQANSSSSIGMESNGVSQDNHDNLMDNNNGNKNSNEPMVDCTWKQFVGIATALQNEMEDLKAEVRERAAAVETARGALLVAQGGLQMAEASPTATQDSDFRTHLTGLAGEDVELKQQALAGAEAASAAAVKKYEEAMAENGEVLEDLAEIVRRVRKRKMQAFLRKHYS